MKCKSCDSEINPKWKYAVDNNTCPFCGLSIMEEELKNLLYDLRITMESLNDYSEQLDDWLLSNFNYIKTDSVNLINYIPKDQLKQGLKLKNNEVEGEKYIVKIKTDQGEQEVVSKKIQPDEKTNEFFKRADAIKPNLDGFSSVSEKTQHLKNMVNKIKKASNGNTSSEVISSDMISELENQIDSGESNDSDDINSYSSDEEEIPAFVLNMANKNSSNSNADLIKLQNMRAKIANSNRNFLNGENRGKNGFSRV